jgi:C4-dicarboxylate transporter DctM subunit
MDPILLSILGICFMFVMIALHVPIGIAMAIAGGAGIWALLGFDPALSLFATSPAQSVADRQLGAIPMFLLMGSFAGAAGLSMDLYRLFNALVGHYRGGLAMATVAGCGAFGTVCGSSIATASTFMRIALPEMLQRGYSPRLSVGCIAASGTLGILIPPSNIMILYGVLTEQYIITLFTALFVPGIICIILYFAATVIYVHFRPEEGPAGPRTSWREKFTVIKNCWGVLSLAFIVSGGIYGGIFTVLEAAAVGCIASFLFTVLRGRLTITVLRKVLIETAGSTGLIYIIIIGANIFAYFITLTQMPQAVVANIHELNLSPTLILMLLIVMYLILGSIFDTVSSMIITLPVVFPLIVGLGWNPIWWGVLNVMLIEIGQITPPIGIVPFVLHGMRPDIPLKTIFTGILPYLYADFTRLAIMAAFPILSLWLPGVMGLLK